MLGRDLPTPAQNTSEFTGSRSKEGMFCGEQCVAHYVFLRDVERCLSLPRISRTRELCKKSTSEEQQDWNKSMQKVNH